MPQIIALITKAILTAAMMKKLLMVFKQKEMFLEF